jgi:tetratricopeptide (TPR) repeat protein
MKIAIAFIIGLALMYAGLQGRQHARAQAMLNDIAGVRDQVQRRLDDEQPVQTPLVNGLKGGLRQFESVYNPRQLSKTQDLEMRLDKATLANAEQRFSDALIMLTDEDEKTQTDHRVRVLQVRADAYYGLREWQKALERYCEMRVLRPNRTATVARIAACQLALGERSQAIVTYGELAKAHGERADALRAQGRADAAKAHYDKAVQVQSWLNEQERQSVSPPKAE